MNFEVQHFRTKSVSRPQKIRPDQTKKFFWALVVTERKKYALTKRKNFRVFLFDVPPRAFGPRRDLNKVIVSHDLHGRMKT